MLLSINATFSSQKSVCLPLSAPRRAAADRSFGCWRWSREDTITSGSHSGTERNHPIDNSRMNTQVQIRSAFLTLQNLKISSIPVQARRALSKMALALLAAAGISATTGTQAAATRTWTGGGANNNWSTALNSDTGAPVSCDSFLFNRATRLH